MADYRRRKNERVGSNISTTRQSEALQFFHKDDLETMETSGEYAAEDSTSEKVVELVIYPTAVTSNTSFSHRKRRATTLGNKDKMSDQRVLKRELFLPR